MACYKRTDDMVKFPNGQLQDSVLIHTCRYTFVPHGKILQTLSQLSDLRLMIILFVRGPDVGRHSWMSQLERSFSLPTFVNLAGNPSARAHNQADSWEIIWPALEHRNTAPQHLRANHITPGPSPSSKLQVPFKYKRSIFFF